MAKSQYLICIVLLIAVSAVLTAGCTSDEPGAQNTTTASTVPTPIPTTERIVTNPPGIIHVQPKFTTGDVVTDDPSNTCVGFVVLKPSPPQDAYVMREANRCTPNNSSWTWTGEPFGRSYAEIDGGAYVAIDHIDTFTVIGPVRTIP